MKEQEFKVFSPSGETLFESLKTVLSQRLVDEIANSDDGYMAQECFDLLVKFLDSNVVPPYMTPPVEMLVLTSWTNPADPTEYHSSRREAHIKRLFASSLLLRIGSEPGNGHKILGPNQYLISAIDSAIYLGPPFESNLLGYTAWIIEHFDQDCLVDELPLFILGLIVLTPRSSSSEFCNKEIPNLITWLRDSDLKASKTESANDSNWPGVLRHTAHNVNHGLWRIVVANVLTKAPKGIAKSVKLDLVAACNFAVGLP